MLKPILSIIVLIASLGLAFFYVKPEYDRTMAHRTNLATLKETVGGSIETIRSIIKQTGDSLNEISPEEFNRLDIFLPESIDQVRFANNLQHIGVLNNLTLLDIKVGEKSKEIKVAGTPQQPTGLVDAVKKVFSINVLSTLSGTAQQKGQVVSEKKYVTTKASFVVIAPYDAFRMFVSDLERSLGIINVTLLSFREEDQTATIGSSSKKFTPPPVPLYRFEVEVRTYSLR